MSTTYDRTTQQQGTGEIDMSEYGLGENAVATPGEDGSYVISGADNDSYNGTWYPTTEGNGVEFAGGHWTQTKP